MADPLAPVQVKLTLTVPATGAAPVPTLPETGNCTPSGQPLPEVVQVVALGLDQLSVAV